MQHVCLYSTSCTASIYIYGPQRATVLSMIIQFVLISDSFYGLFIWLFSGLSDVSSATPTPQPVMTADMQNTIRALNSRAKELKAELRHLRRMQLANAESMRETFQQTFLKIKVGYFSPSDSDKNPSIV